MTSNGLRNVEGYRGFTIDADRIVRNRFGNPVKQQIKSGTTYVVIGNVKDGTRRTVQLEEIYARAFGMRVKETMRPTQLHRVKRDAAWRAAEGDLEINAMMDDLQRGVKGNKTRKRFSLVDAAEVLAAIGQMEAI